ncbi:MAG: peptide deformylase [Verrucomicrobia bacterium]|nr:peptide deformylase [Verrucomicrobiota bacterium]
MVLRITKYGEPVLREKGQPIEKMDESLHAFIDDMFDTMEAANGIGLAAQQVGRAMQLCIVDVSDMDDRPSRLWIDGKECDVEAFMPLVLINPTLELSGEQIPGPEGCLSFPEIYGEVSRPDKAKVKALDGYGKAIEFECSGLLSRCIQHEVDHLNGLLFIDRMDKAERERIREEISGLAEDTRLWLEHQAPKKA